MKDANEQSASGSVHQVKHQEIELLTPYNARAFWAMEDIEILKKPGLLPTDLIHGFEYCDERYKKWDEAWWIAGYRLEWLMMDYAPRPIAKQHPV